MLIVYKVKNYQELMNQKRMLLDALKEKNILVDFLQRHNEVFTKSCRVKYILNDQQLIGLRPDIMFGFPLQKIHEYHSKIPSMSVTDYILKEENHE